MSENPFPFSCEVKNVNELMFLLKCLKHEEGKNNKMKLGKYFQIRETLKLTERTEDNSVNSKREGCDSVNERKTVTEIPNSLSAKYSKANIK